MKDLKYQRRRFEDKRKLCTNLVKIRFKDTLKEV
jgi:hypothetical protein